MVPLKKMVYVEDKAEYLPEDEVKPYVNVKRISSSELRRRLENGLDIPEWFSYPEVVSELRRAYPPRSKQGFTIFLTGLSGAGKSTVAKVLVVKFMEMRDRPVTLLDGDIVRRNLSSELTFSKDRRNLNITRIGFVAGEITKNGRHRHLCPHRPLRGIETPQPGPHQPLRRVHRSLPFHPAWRSASSGTARGSMPRPAPTKSRVSLELMTPISSPATRTSPLIHRN